MIQTRFCGVHVITARSPQHRNHYGELIYKWVLTILLI
jgi:hypothetical protein